MRIWLVRRTTPTRHNDRMWVLGEKHIDRLLQAKDNVIWRTRRRLPTACYEKGVKV